MIRFRKNTLLVKDETTQTLVPLDEDALQALLDRAFTQCGSQDQLLAATLIEALGRHIGEEAEQPCPLTKTELHQLIIRLLRDLGQPNVADAFAQMTQDSPVMSSCQNIQAINTETLPPISQKTRYIAADDWRIAWDEEMKMLLQKKVLALKPLSDLRPQIAIDCRPSRLYDLPASPRTELELHLLLPQLASQIARLLQKLREEIQRRWDRPAEQTAQVNFWEINALVQVSCPSRAPRERQRFREQLCEEMEVSLRQITGFQLLTNFYD